MTGRFLLAFVIGLVLAVCFGHARAAERCPVGLMVGSVHFDPNREEQLSGVNPGAYLLCERWAAGLYRDSRERPAAFGGIAMQREGLALVVGLKGTRDGIEPALIGSIRMGPVRLLATPPWGRTPAALALALEF